MATSSIHRPATSKLTLLNHARRINAEFGDPATALEPGDALVFAERVDEAATIAVGKVSLADWREAAQAHSPVHQPGHVRSWLRARDEFGPLLRAVWRHDRFVAGDLDMWDEFGLPKTDDARRVALAECEDDVETCLTVLAALVDLVEVAA